MTAGRPVPRLADISARLDRSMDAASYRDRRYYLIPNGFAVMSQLEQFDINGRYNGNRRFAPPEAQDFDPLESVRNIFFAPVGYYRYIVFLVTDQPVIVSNHSMDRPEAISRFDQGAAAAPNCLDQIEFGDRYRVTALVYEYRKVGDDRSAPVPFNSPVGIERHLTASGLLAALSRRL